MPRRSSASEPPSKTSVPHSGERGYVLITLIFFVAVLAISLATILPRIQQEILRDREEEMVHRGVQYERAIRLYYKKMGRYPAKVEDLESTNNLRFLRKRYKDLTVKGENAGGGDFKILRIGDPGVPLLQAGGAAATPVQTGAPGFNSAAPGTPVTTTTATNPSANQSPQPDPGNIGQNAGAPPLDANGNPIPGATSAATGTTGDSTSATSPDKPASGNPVFGGGAMVGVVSTNTNVSPPFYPAIREYNKKHHYNEWMFLYDPQADRGGLPNGPWQPPKLLGVAGNGQPQQIGTPASQVAGDSANGASQNSNPASEPVHPEPQQ